jgi:hypothetical protein
MWEYVTGELAAPRYAVSSLLKVSAVGLALLLSAPTVASAQMGGSRPASPASFRAIPKYRVRIGTPNALPGPGVPWISEQADAPRVDRGPRLPKHVQPAVARLDADRPPAPANDVVIIPVTTILIVLLVVVVVLAVD